MSIGDDRLKARVQQGLNCKTWTPPPFYGSLTIPDMYTFHAEHSSEHPVIVYDDELGEEKTLRHKDAFKGVQKAAELATRHVQRVTSGADNTILGILAVADFPTLWTLILGTMYAGHTPFPISIRNSAPAVAQLLRKTATRLLLVSPDAAMQRLAQEAKDILAKEQYSVQLLPLPSFADFYNTSAVGPVQRVAVNPTSRALILHSSGSTSFPKPITLLHSHLSRWAWVPCFGGQDWCGMRISMHCLPMFHMMGMWTIAFGATTGMVIGGFRPSSPPIMINPENVLNGAVATKCVGTFCVPAFIEVWARDPTLLAKAQNLKFITTAAAPLSKDIGNMLLERGISLSTGFGATEYGGVTFWNPMPKNKDWEYFSFIKPVEIIRRYQEGLPGIFELVILESPTWSPNVFNCEIEGRRGFATNDLLVEHPENPDLFRVYGRLDDQIALSTGEKTNPVPIETILLQDPHIQAVIMFGRGQAQNGVIIQPKEPFDSRDESSLAAFRNLVWPTVERANSIAPSHSCIFKETITVTSPSKPFQYTAKGTPRRHVCLADYKEEIEEVYKKVEESSQSQIPLPPAWSEDSMRQYLREVIETILNIRNIQDGDDLFQQGCDSLKATWIRNTILHALRTTTKVSVHAIPQQFLYANPSIAALTSFLCGFLNGKTVNEEVERSSRLAQMSELVAKYSQDFQQAAWVPQDGIELSLGEVVVITGTTGGVGSHLLARLLQTPSVRRIYALNREKSGDREKLITRQRGVFRLWGLDDTLLNQGKVSFHVSDLATPYLGLDAAVFTEVQNSMTAIIHCAWRVDFNLSLPSFEPLIASTRYILDFALTSRLPGGPQVMFLSSVSALRNHATASPLLESLDHGPELAVGQGYGESKWVTEQILWRARNNTGLRTTSVRIGQLSGDSHSGGWNTKEWVPAIVNVSKTLGCAPASDRNVVWVPIDVASVALLEMLRGGANEPILHLTSPRTSKWNDVWGPIAEHLGVPLVPVHEWVEKLQASASTMGETRAGAGAGEYHSAYALISFFTTVMLGTTQDTSFGTDKAFKIAPSLSTLGPLGKEDVLTWVAYWEQVGFLKG